MSPLPPSLLLLFLAVVVLLPLYNRWMRDRYAPFILSRTGKVLVLIATGGLLVAGIFGVTKVGAVILRPHIRAIVRYEIRGQR